MPSLQGYYNQRFRIIQITKTAYNVVGSLSSAETVYNPEKAVFTGHFGLSPAFKLVMSDDTTDAKDYIGTFGYNIVNLDSDAITAPTTPSIHTVVVNETDLWDGTLGDPIRYDMEGIDRGTLLIRTGTLSNGTKDAGTTISQASCTCGSSVVVNSTWIDSSLSSGNLYGYYISDPVIPVTGLRSDLPADLSDVSEILIANTFVVDADLRMPNLASFNTTVAIPTYQSGILEVPDAVLPIAGFPDVSVKINGAGDKNHTIEGVVNGLVHQS